MGFVGLFSVDSLGHSGGLAIMLKEEVDIIVISYSRNHNDALVKLEGGDNTWRFTGFYSKLERNRRREPWQLLNHLSTVNSLSWVVIGDFNDIRFQVEKRGRNQHPNWLCRGFNQAIEDSGLHDLDFEGTQFTWEKS